MSSDVKIPELQLRSEMSRDELNARIDELQSTILTIPDLVSAAEQRGRKAGLEEAAKVAIPREVIDRYYRMVPATIEPKCEPEPGTSSAHIKWMLLQLYDMQDFGKAMRWLGFIQGILIGMRGYTTVKAERDFTRPFFAASIRSLGEKT